MMGEQLVTDRLVLRPWRLDDAEQALEVYGQSDVAKWLSPAMDSVQDISAMRLVLEQWIGESDRLDVPAGRWAIERSDDGRVIGGAVLLPLPPGNADLEMGWALHPDVWGRGYATEAASALAQWAFDAGHDEVFAVARPKNTRGGAVARRIGMEWVGETDKYYDLRLQVFRLRAGDFKAAS
jgi:RimJ/RimL family protein N-acetyltransferase